MRENPLVSVVIAVYNGEKYLPELLDSVLQQTYPNIEVIAVDDKSTDRSMDILNRYNQRYPNLRVFENGSNLGYIKNFERAFTLANGDYIAPCDQDDIWSLDKLSILVNEIKNGYPIVYCDSEYIDANGAPMGMKLSDIRNQIDFDDPLMFTIGSSAPGHAMLIEKAVLQQCYPFPESMVHDRWIGFIATLYGPLRYVDTPLVKYRQHDNNVCGGGKEAIRNRKPNEKPELTLAQERIAAFYERAPNGYHKEVFASINESYKGFSLRRNLLRSTVFYRHRDKIMAWKRRSAFRKILFCFKMFFRIL